MQDEDICTQALMVLATSCTILAAMLIVHVIGVASEEASSMTTSTGAVVSEVRHGRLTAFGANPNGIATTLSTGLLAFIGLVFGPGKRNVGTRLLAWPCMGILAIAIVRTGTRGAVVAIMVGLIVFLLSGKGVSPRLKAWVKRSRLKIGLAAVGVNCRTGKDLQRSVWHVPGKTVAWMGTCNFRLRTGITAGHSSSRPAQCLSLDLAGNRHCGSCAFLCRFMAVLAKRMEGAWWQHPQYRSCRVDRGCFGHQSEGDKP
jgi:hypothetical protein